MVGSRGRGGSGIAAARLEAQQRDRQADDQRQCAQQHIGTAPADAGDGGSDQWLGDDGEDAGAHERDAERNAPMALESTGHAARPCGGQGARANGGDQPPQEEVENKRAVHQRKGHEAEAEQHQRADGDRAHAVAVCQHARQRPAGGGDQRHDGKAAHDFGEAPAEVPHQFGGEHAKGVEGNGAQPQADADHGGQNERPALFELVFLPRRHNATPATCQP